MVPATGNKIQGNYIGTDKSGALPLGVSWGVYIHNATQTLVLGPNPGDGTSSPSARLRRRVRRRRRNAKGQIINNSIHSNGGLGINLGTDSVTPNDANDADTGPNGLQNFPVISSAKIEGGQTKVTGTLNSVAGLGYRMHFYANTSCDSSGHGEGQNALGSVYVQADNNDTPFTVTLPAVAPGTFITATASSGGTSEFSPCVPATEHKPHRSRSATRWSLRGIRDNRRRLPHYALRPEQSDG